MTQNPEPLDHLDWDVIVPEISDIHGVPARWLRSLENVQQIRQGRAEQAEQKSMVEAAPGAAAIMNAETKAKAS